MRPTHALIDLAAVRHNVSVIRRHLPAHVHLTAVVKANAYGHGAAQVAKAALAGGATGLAVAIPEEGAELRQAGFCEPILVLGLVLPEQADFMVTHRLTPTVATKESLEALSEAAGKENKTLPVMLKIETGMNRIGLPQESALELAQAIQKTPHVRLLGAFTHLATADAADKAYAKLQLQRFSDTVESITRQGIHLEYVSAANSATIIDLPEGHHNQVRAGIIIYGLPPSGEMHRSLDLKPVMSLKTKVAFIKKVPSDTPVNYGCTYRTPQESYLATLPIGYADGFSRRFSSNGEVLIGGRRYPIVGRVCMDQIVVNLGSECTAAIGDDVVLIGRQGNEEITATELAGKAGTINYEIVSALTARIPRIYIDSEAE